MNSKRKGLFGVLVAVIICAICLLILLPRGRPPMETDESSEKTRTVSAASREAKAPLSREVSKGLQAETRRRFGVLVWPGMAARKLNYSRTILSWMEEWGFECGFVTAQGTAGNDPSSLLPADVTNNAWDLSDVSESLNSIVLADGGLPPAEVSAVKEYLLSGGWAIMPTPEGGRISADVEELIQLTPSRAATLMAPESPHSIGPLGAEEVRLLVSHSLAPGLAPDQWVEWAGPPGKVLYARRDEALPLLCFRRPELPAVRLVPFEDGGVVHWNFPLQPGPLIEDTELKTFLGDTLAWLFARANWPEPTQKEGSLKGIVREREGQAIPDAKVTAQVYSEWGQPVQSFEVSSSEGGEFAFPVVEPAIYWVKAEAEGYYQVDSYLLARPAKGESPPIEVLMEPEGSIFGHAYYGPGEDHPAGGVSVTLAPNCRVSSAWGSETVTDNEGRFSFDKLPSAQTFYLVAKAEGWLGLQEAPLPLDGDSLEVDIHLEIPLTLGGVTVDAATGKRLAGVEVSAWPGPKDGTRFLFADALTQVGTSNEDGRFEVKIDEGKWCLTGEAPGFSKIPCEVEMTAAGETDPSEVVVELCPHVALHGTVFQSSGQPAPQARVTVEKTREYWADEQGRYRTDPVPPGPMTKSHPRVRFALHAYWNDEYGWSFPSFQFVKEGEPPARGPSKSYSELLTGACAIDLHLNPGEAGTTGATIRGIVMTEAGDPTASARVEVCQVLMYPGGSSLIALAEKSTVSDHEGKFEFSGVKPGLWLIRARKKVRAAEGKVSLLWGERWQTVTEGAPVASLKLTLGKAHIHGKVLQAGGATTRNRRVKFSLTYFTGGRSDIYCFLQEEGDFSLFPYYAATVLTRPPSAAYKEWLRNKWKSSYGQSPTVSLLWEKGELPAEGHVRLAVSAPGARKAELGDVRWGEESLVIGFGPEGSIKGRVTDADTRSPIPGAHLSLSRGGRHVASCYADRYGAYSFPAVPVGPCLVAASRDGYWSCAKEPQVVEGGEVQVDIEIWTYWIIHGRLLLKETGQPVQTEVRTGDGVYLSGRDGRFTLPVAARKGEYFSLYWFDVPVDGTDLKPVRQSVKHVPRVREIDIGDVYLERETEE